MNSKVYRFQKQDRKKNEWFRLMLHIRLFLASYTNTIMFLFHCSLHNVIVCLWYLIWILLVNTGTSLLTTLHDWLILQKDGCLCYTSTVSLYLCNEDIDRHNLLGLTSNTDNIPNNDLHQALGNWLYEVITRFSAGFWIL